MNNAQHTTHGIVHAGFSGLRTFVARKKSRCKLIGNRLVFPHDTIPSNVSCNKMKQLFTYIGLFISTSTFSQVEYFQYNNPYVIEITEDVLEKLTSTTWHGNYILDYRGDDTVKTNLLVKLRYNINNTFDIGFVGGQEWKIKKGKYIEHSTIDIAGNDWRSTLLTGIWGITELNDSTLHLEKLQTSSHDMQRHIYFSDKNNAQKYRQLNSLEYNDRFNREFGIKNLDKMTLDSISKLATEELFFYNYEYTESVR